MAFREADELRDYWAQWPPFHVLMRGYVGYIPPRRAEDYDIMEVSKTLAAISGRPRAAKLSTAPLKDQEIFKDLKNWKPNGR